MQKHKEHLLASGNLAQTDIESASVIQLKRRADGEIESLGRILIGQGRLKEAAFHEIIRMECAPIVKTIKKGEEFGYILDQIELLIGKDSLRNAKENKKATADPSNLLVVLNKLRLATSKSQKIFIYDLFRPFINDLILARPEKITMNNTGGKIIYMHDGQPVKLVFIPEIGSRYPQALLSAEEYFLVTEAKMEQIGEDDETENDMPFSISAIVSDAYVQEASDIHIVPNTKSYYVFFRIQGDLIAQPRYTLDSKHGVKLVKALKRNASTTGGSGFDADNNRIVQDGRIAVEDINGRVVTLPDGALLEEALVCRVSRKTVLERTSLVEQGYFKEDAEFLLRAFNRQNGFFIISGITGSGKTTLAAQLLMTDTIRKWETIENPIENIIPNPNICQHQIYLPKDHTSQERMGYLDLISGFKRADPNGIYIGEIRREDGLVLAAIEAAYAGQLVMSTIHIRNAFEIYRAFKEVFGLDYYTTASLVIFSQNQSLVKTLCDCKIEDKYGKNKTELNKYKDELSYIVKDELQQFIDDDIGQDTTFVKNPTGCAKCNHTGYKGRTILYEYFYPTTEFKKWLLDNEPDPYTIEQKTCSGEKRIGVNKLQIFIKKLKCGIIDVSPATIRELL